MKRRCALRKEFVLWCTLIVFFSLLVSASLSSDAQVATSSLRGFLADGSGARIAGARVILSSALTGFQRITSTNDRGEYQFLQVPPGTYALQLAAPGFADIRRDNITLLVNTPETLDLTMQVHRVESTEEVTAEPVGVNTSDATVGNAFDSTQIGALPSEGRNAVELLSLQAGVAYVGNQVNTGADSRGGAVNGARSDQTNVTVDGMDDNDQLLGLAFTGALRVPMDSLEEFRVTTTNANADSGRSSGAQVTLVTKSGTNRFQGSLYEYNRTLFGAANDWFNKQSQIAGGLPNKPGQLIRNTFGASLGGPIWKDRLFFFGNYEGQRSREAVQTTQAVPSAALREGAVSYLAEDGSTVTLQPSDIRSLDQGCLASGTCPNGNGPSQAVLDVWNGVTKLPDGASVPAYPMPNTPTSFGSDGMNILGYTFAAPQPASLNTVLVRLDYHLKADGSQSLFFRGNLQDDLTQGAPQFPGEPPSETLHNNSKALAVGYTVVLGPTRINSLRYGYVRQGQSQSGPNDYSSVSFWNMSDPVSWVHTTNVTVPVHQVVDDFTWTLGRHNVQTGGNWRVITNNRSSNDQNFFSASMHPTWLFEGGIAGTGQDLDPANGAFTPVDPGFQYSYDAAISNVTGLLGSTSAYYNQNKSGRFLTEGSLVPRHFRSNEAEGYFQDSWRAASNLQLTLGVRYSFLQVPYETDGNQVAPTPGMSEFFKNRTSAMEMGEVYRPAITFGLSGKANGKAPFWSADPYDFAPRFAFAYSPNPSSGLWRAVLGSGNRTSIRGGAGISFDHFGQGVVNSFDREGSYGLTSYLENPSGVQTTDCVARFAGLTAIPTTDACGGIPELPGQPPAGFPFVPAGGGGNGAFAVAWGLDDKMKTPYAETYDFSISRELPSHLVVEVSYVGRFGRHLLQEVDVATPVNMTDPASGMTYFQAARQLAELANSNTPESSVGSIAFWEDMFPAAAGAGGVSGSAPGIPSNPTATQNIYDLYYANAPNYTYALQSLDAPAAGGSCFPACSRLGPYAFWDDQFSALYLWETTGTSNYNGVQLMLRRHVAGLEFDFNYTYSKSMDENSNAERVNEYENGTGLGSASAVAWSGQVINAWDPKGLYGPSDFDLRHQINTNWVYQLPIGRGKRIGSNWNRVEDGLLGGWEFSGLLRWSSGFPFSIATYAFGTDYEQDGRAVLVGKAPKTGLSLDGGTPNVFKNGPTVAASAFRFAYPGESGQRNNFRGPGYFGIDTSVAKTWKLSERQALRLTWDGFNMSNAVRFDVGTLNQELLYSSTLGDLSETITKPRVMQFGLRYAF